MRASPALVLQLLAVVALATAATAACPTERPCRCPPNAVARSYSANGCDSCYCMRIAEPMLTCPPARTCACKPDAEVHHYMDASGCASCSCKPRPETTASPAGGPQPCTATAVVVTLDGLDDTQRAVLEKCSAALREAGVSLKSIVGDGVSAVSNNDGSIMVYSVKEIAEAVEELAVCDTPAPPSDGPTAAPEVTTGDLDDTDVATTMDVTPSTGCPRPARVFLVTTDGISAEQADAIAECVGAIQDAGIDLQGISFSSATSLAAVTDDARAVASANEARAVVAELTACEEDDNPGLQGDAESAIAGLITTGGGTTAAAATAGVSFLAVLAVAAAAITYRRRSTSARLAASAAAAAATSGMEWDDEFGPE